MTITNESKNVTQPETSPSPLSAQSNERQRISIPSIEHLWEYLNYQFPATCGNIPLHNFCNLLAAANKEEEGEHRKIHDQIQSAMSEARKTPEYAEEGRELEGGEDTKK